MPPGSAAPEAIVLPGVREAIRTTETIIGGSVASLSAADSGHFGPGSVSWRIFRHPSYSVSGIAAVLAQALHPVAMAGVDQHSDFRRDAWRRAHMTTDYVFTVTFSSRSVADSAAARVRRIHRSVTGTDPSTGRRYAADDSDLLLWIHCVHTRYALAGYEAYAARLSAPDRDRFVEEQIRAAGLVGLPADTVPRTWEGLEAYMAASQRFPPTPPASQFYRMLMRARMPLAMRPFWALHVVGALALLPEDVRRAYGTPSRLPRGRLTVTAIRVALWIIDRGFWLSKPVRAARARLREVERAARLEARGAS